MTRVAIIGAGISGLICGGELSQRCDVTLFDKSRGVAGRMATRRVPEHAIAFDHGAQYFTVRSDQVRTYLEAWIDDQVVAPWNGEVVVLDPDAPPRTEATQRFVAIPGMNSLGKYLAAKLKVETGRRIASAQRKNDVWRLIDESGEDAGTFDLLLVTTPPEQAQAILGDEVSISSRLGTIEFHPCWATLLHLEHRLNVPWDGALVNGNPLRWVCRNNSKPGRNPDLECWVLHGGEDWSRTHLEKTPEEVTPLQLAAFTTAIGKPVNGIRFVTSHRWRYSAPANPLEQPCLWEETNRVGACGDWCGGPRVEGAILSGLALANCVLS